MVTPPMTDILALAGPEQCPIQSRWQHAAVPTWWPVPPTAVCEVAFTLHICWWRTIAYSSGDWQSECHSDSVARLLSTSTDHAGIDVRRARSTWTCWVG